MKNPERPIRLLGATLILLTVGVLDYVTGAELSFALFYLIPIAMYALGLGRHYGILGALLSAIVWFYTEAATAPNRVSLFIHLWNALIRLGFFLFPAILLKMLEQERLHARTDSLTGAFNHRHFHEVLETEIYRSARYNLTFSVAFVDVDNFKTVNDTFGHVFGDEILRSIVEIMRASLRKTDVVGRVGGDELIVLLPETDETAARAAISHMHQALTDGMYAKKCPITFSVGVLTLTAPQISSDKILGLADKVMYQVKNGGKSGIRFETYRNPALVAEEPASTHPQS